MIYIALLRGINVSGHNKIKMAELKTALEAIGLKQVQTYIQSGNVLFESDGEAEALRRQIEQQIRSVFGFNISVMLRTEAEWGRILAECPFDEEACADGKSVQVALLNEPLAPKQIDTLSAGIGELDEFRINGLEIYFYFRQSILDSKLANNLQKLGDRTTSRNWNTMNKLDEMAKAIGN